MFGAAARNTINYDFQKIQSKKANETFPMPKRLDIKRATAELIKLLDKSVGEPDLEEVQKHIDNGADVCGYLPTPHRDIATIIATKGYLNLVEIMVNNGMDISKPIRSGYAPPLLVAARKGHDKMMKSLIEDFGADPTYIDSEDEVTLVHSAAYSNNPECLRIALHYCPDQADAKDIKGYTPLFALDHDGENSPSCIAQLLEAGAKPNFPISEKKNQPAFFKLSGAAWTTGIDKDKKLERLDQIVDDYLRYGADFNIRDDEGHTMLKNWMADSAINDTEAGVAQRLIDTGMTLTYETGQPTYPESEAKNARIVKLIEKNKAEAMAKWQKWAAKPNIDTVTKDDLLHFANIDKLGAAFSANIWADHTDKAVALLDELPPFLQKAALHQQPWLAQQIAEPNLPVKKWTDRIQETPAERGVA